MKGWLDNYNDSKVSAPEGFQGEGYSMKGRNYSPAWGGQFQDGGAIYVSSENDPRYKSYADSLYNYNIGNKLKSVVKSIPSLVEIKKGSPYDKALQKTLMKSKNRGLVDNTNNPNSKTIDPRVQALMKEYQKKGNKGIKPIRYNSFIDDPDNAAMDIITGRGLTDLIGLTKERPKGYNLPEWKKPKQKVVVKPETKKSSGTPIYNPSEKRWEVEGTIKRQPKKKVEVVQPDLPMVEAINLSPIQSAPISFPTQEIDTTKRFEEPKSFNVSSQRYNMQGPSDYYQANEEGIDYERAMQMKAASDAYNRDIEKRYGPQNEYRTPKSAEKAAERLKQLRSEFEMTPNYQMGGSVYPVNYVPQAQDGDIIPSDLPDPVNGIIYDPEGERTYYDSRLDRIVLTPSSNFSPRQSVINHEKFHKYQFDNLGSNYEITHQGAVPLFKKPSMVSTDEEYYKFHNRKGREAQQDIENVKSNYPEFKFVPNDILFDKLIDRAQYSNPYTLEGEAQAYENSLNKYQMGGSIPGAVGFTYARTKGIPSEGPYAKKTMPSAQNGQEMKYYQEGLDWRPKTISKNGSVIKDDMGQWAHPGEITEINSPYITMKGVPYPVLGISDTGDTQMMYPEEEYEFDGTKVTEFPMAKNGLRQEQKGLVNLDNLLNFTNYNTKQPGGWLDKY
jgi:hypothetical protein